MKNQVNIFPKSNMIKIITVLSLLLIGILFYETSLSKSINYVSSNISGRLRLNSSSRILNGIRE